MIIKSDCCNAPVKDAKPEDKTYYQCINCGKPCTVHKEEK